MQGRADHRNEKSLSLPKQGSGGVLHKQERKDNLGRLPVGHPPRSRHRQLHDRGRDRRQDHRRSPQAASVIQAHNLQRGHRQGVSSSCARQARLLNERDNARARYRHSRISVKKQLREGCFEAVPRDHDDRSERQQPQHQPRPRRQTDRALRQGLYRGRALRLPLPHFPQELLPDKSRSDGGALRQCGIGTIGIVAAKNGAGRVIGVELNGDAVRDAITNAKRNGLKNIRFYKGDAGEFMESAAEEDERPDVVFMDPPRAGSSEKFLRSLIKMSPERVVYVSCNPETLARDLRFLADNSDYKVKKIQPVDMFPHTEHIETVVLLSRKIPDDKIEVDLDLDELNLTSAESKATYQEIKDYVLKEYGFKVSTLYISQVKRKCGIIERENYNHSRKENPHIPQCPKDKEDAIRAALEHFAMI